jgi:hypothetical protein
MDGPADRQQPTGDGRPGGDQPSAASAQAADDGGLPQGSGPTVAPGEPCPTCGQRTRTPAQRAAPGGTRLGQGQLHEMALEHLRAYPGAEFTATGIAKVIGRSSGAIANALVTMANRDEAEMACAATAR